ncbi:conserved exported hypothetical protein [Tenacibaculum sp. 190130A14a]|uniref:Secreted protein n=1 Tax=Tenacibaculum polynesiense TaxID=3137857 RepID=A0ABM9PG51_9FLAO
MKKVLYVFACLMVICLSSCTDETENLVQNEKEREIELFDRYNVDREDIVRPGEQGQGGN